MIEANRVKNSAAHMFRTAAVSLIITGAMALAGCATKPVEVPPPPIAQKPVAPKPKPPRGIIYEGTIPARDAAGVRQTLNSGITPAQTLWNLRSALNVAALNCQGAEYASILPAYKELLVKHKKPLRTANKAIEDEFRAKYGDKLWRGELDSYLTKLYNYFSFPGVKKQFCTISAEVSQEFIGTKSDMLQDYAAKTLPYLETPFLGFYNEYDQYLAELKAWEAAQATPPQEAQNSTVAPAQ